MCTRPDDAKLPILISYLQEDLPEPHELKTIQFQVARNSQLSSNYADVFN